jgi:hypothetical protein
VSRLVGSEMCIRDRVLDLVTSGIAALNHRLKASIPPGCKEIKGGPGKKKPSPFSAPGTPLFGM